MISFLTTFLIDLLFIVTFHWGVWKLVAIADESEDDQNLTPFAQRAAIHILVHAYKK